MAGDVNRGTSGESSSKIMRLVLPYPVSANRYWRTIVNKKTLRAMTFVSDEAKSFKTEVGWLAKAAGLRFPSDRPIELAVTLVPRNGVCMDLDNALKVTIDALKGIAYVDDSQVQRIVAQRADPDPTGAKTIVEITEFIPKAVRDASAIQKTRMGD